MKNEMLNLFNSICLSNNVCQNYHTNYDNNNTFREWVDCTIPDLKKCGAQKQNNPWHIYNVLDHILHSIEQINILDKNYDNKTRLILSYVMLFHDIGKPDTHIERMKDGKLIDSFFNHNKRSCEIAKTTLPKLNIDDSTISIICKLVLDHDIFMFLSLDKTDNPYQKQLTKKVVQDEISEFDSVGDGKKLIRYLVMVGKSDNLSQNPTMTAKSLILIDTFEKMID